MKFGGKECDQAQGYRNIFGPRLSKHSLNHINRRGRIHFFSCLRLWAQADSMHVRKLVRREK
jgi:hypothetical protein